MNDKYIKAIQNDLIQLADEKYKNFQAKLIPTVNPDTVIGVRTPVLRSYADKIYKTGEYAEFIQSLPHKYYDENNLHSFLICKIKDYDILVEELERFLPYVDNWATCDSLRPACLKKQKEKLLKKIKLWLKSEDVFTVRFALEMLMVHFLDEDFKPEYLQWVSEVRRDEYYIRMMISWYFATALIKRYDDTVSYIENRCLDPWVHNKTIQKACESLCIDKEIKQYLRDLKMNLKN